MALGLNPQRQLEFFHIFPLLISRPLLVRKFQSSFYEGSELDNCDVKAFLIQTPLGEKDFYSYKADIYLFVTCNSYYG